MIIDFHTHIFPDRIAEKTIEHLSLKGSISPFSDGTKEGLCQRLREANTDIALNLSVLTSPSRFESVNRFAKEVNETFAENGNKGIMSFAGIHPECNDLDIKMKWIKDNGFLGIKLHPDYQETFIDDERYERILALAKELDLIVVTHSGADIAYRGFPVRCTPDRALKLIKKIRHPKLVLAHMGASEMSEEVYEKLCGEDVYFDTAFVLRFTDRETFTKIVKKHGDDKILFGSDSPWSGIDRDIDIIHSFDLTKNTEDKIFFENSKKLLGL
jgi:predicted TIM-barrel fold metal-dependent hydrolase